MTINFPSSPSVDQVFNNGSNSFIWNGTQWVGYSTAAVSLSLVGYATEGYVDSSVVGFITSGALSGYATEGYVDSSVVGFITSGASGASLTGIVTSITAGSGININQSTGNVTISGSVVGSIDDLSDVDTSSVAPSEGQVLLWDSINSKWEPGTVPELASVNAIIPFAFARIAGTSNGSGIGITWSNWTSGGGVNSLDFTFDVAQPDANYSIITDSDKFDDTFVEISNKTTAGFTAGFYNSSTDVTPSSFNSFNFVIYGSDPRSNIAVAAGAAEIRDDGSTIGIATVIDFGSNLSVSTISAGIVTITGSASGGVGESYWESTTAGIHTFSNVGIGTTNPTSKLTVSGDVLVSGVVTAASFSGSASDLTNIPSGQLTGALPAIDGSALTGIVASGTGVVIEDNATPVGTARTINFGSNLSVSFGSGIATITATGGGGGESYWTSTLAGIHTLSNVGVGITNPLDPIQVERYLLSTGIGTFNALVGAAHTFDSFTISLKEFKTVEYLIHIQNGSKIQSQKLLIMQDADTVYWQDYALMFNESRVVSVGATISSGICEVKLLPSSGISGLTTYRFKRGGLV